MPNPSTYTTTDFLNKIYDFFSLVNHNQEEWSFKALQDNPPRFVRLKQIVSLYNAFIGNNDNLNETEILIALTTGSFLSNENVEDYYSLIATMEQYIIRLVPAESKHKEWGTFALESNFERLIKYRLSAGKLLTFNDGYLQVSYHNLFSKTTIDETNNQIKNSLSHIDDILVKFIGYKTFALEILIDNYNFPTDNLDEIDEDFI